MDLRELYQTTILDHNKRPRNHARPEGANRSAEGHNPLCGDQVRVHLRVEDDRVRAIGFEGGGCAISQASASLMTEAVQGRTLEEALEIFDRFHRFVTSEPGSPVDAEKLGKLVVFGGVREFPMRVKCVSLSWHTLRAAVHADGSVATTE